MAPQKEGSGGGGGSDGSLDFLWMIGVLIVGTLLIWYFGKVQITRVVFFLRYHEISAIQFLAYYWMKLNLLLPKHILPMPNVKLLDAWKTYITQTKDAADFQSLANVSTLVGSYTRFPAMLILGGAAAIIYFEGIGSQYNKTYNVKSLRAQEQANWPQIAPVIPLDLTNVPLDEMPWAMALSPMPYCKKHNLLIEETKNGKLGVILKRGEAQRLFSLQLGPEWHGPDALPPHLKALFAIFICRVNNDKKTASKLLAQFSISAAKNKIDYSDVPELIKKYGYTKPVLKIVRLHGYTTTVMASLLTATRETGVLASSEFIWLKAYDRRMWYMLNSVGRQTAVSEISGAFAHWLAEKKIGLPLKTPMVEEAVNGLEAALKDILYKKEED